MNFDATKMEKVLKSVANRRRLAILGFIKKEREATVGDIARKIKLSFRSTSHHLRLLAAVGILEKEQRKREMYYRLSFEINPTVRSIISIL